jgi:hypothetical protein
MVGSALLGAAGLVVVRMFLGGAVLGVAAAILVITVGVWLVRLPISDKSVRAVKKDVAGCVHLPDEVMREKIRQTLGMLGFAAVVAGGVGLVLAIAAL